jgi:hypothetical protein
VAASAPGQKRVCHSRRQQQRRTHLHLAAATSAAGMQFVLALDHVFFRPREPAPTTISFSVALLFALPVMRITQPEVPPIGEAVDVLGFWNISIWNISITALVGCPGD